MNQTTIMISLFVIQFVTSIFGAHYKIGTPEIVTRPEIVQRISNPTFWDFIMGRTYYIWDSVTDNALVQLLEQMLNFSWKMMTFDVKDLPEVFNYIWLLMTFVVIWILVDKIRGHNS